MNYDSELDFQHSNDISYYYPFNPQVSSLGNCFVDPLVLPLEPWEAAVRAVLSSVSPLPRYPNQNILMQYPILSPY